MDEYQLEYVFFKHTPQYKKGRFKLEEQHFKGPGKYSYINEYKTIDYCIVDEAGYLHNLKGPAWVLGSLQEDNKIPFSSIYYIHGIEITKEKFLFEKEYKEIIIGKQK